MDCAVYYLGYCPLELWPLAGLVALTFLVLCSYERGEAAIAPGGWFIRATFQSLLISAAFTFYYYNFTVPGLGNLEENLSACSDRNRMAYMHACRR